MGGRGLLIALALVVLAMGLGLLVVLGPNVALTAGLVVFVAALLWRMNRRVGGR
jgi:hypothetical protein